MEKPIFWHGRTYSRKQADVLIKNNFKNIPSEKHKSISKKGGIASGIARRKKKAEKDYCMEIFNKSMRLSGFLDEEIKDFERWQKYIKKKKPKKPG